MGVPVRCKIHYVIPAKRIQTTRLSLRSAEPKHAQSLSDFLQRNEVHLARWSPASQAGSVTLSRLEARLTQAQQDFEYGRSWRWHLYLSDDPKIIVGHANFSQIFRGVFHNCMLGYSLEKDCEGQGLMTEALRALLTEVFSPRGQIHRVQANVVPENTRSLNLFTRLGFNEEGRATDYLFIDGKWRDHIMTARLNPDFDPGWLDV